MRRSIGVPCSSGFRAEITGIGVRSGDDNRFDIGLRAEYGAELYEALQNSGFTNVYLKENQSGYATICDDFINETDISLLEWLFEQRRETK